MTYLVPTSTPPLGRFIIDRVSGRWLFIGASTVFCSVRRTHDRIEKGGGLEFVACFKSLSHEYVRDVREVLFRLCADRSVGRQATVSGR